MKTAKRELMYKRIEEHGKQLQVIFPSIQNLDPVKVCKTLFRIEKQLHKNAEYYCNGQIDENSFERNKNKFKKQLIPILGESVPWFINSDPRGYALKIKDDYMRENNIQLDRDLGGYGILAPDFSE